MMTRMDSRGWSPICGLPAGLGELLCNLTARVTACVWQDYLSGVGEEYCQETSVAFWHSLHRLLQLAVSVRLSAE
jgi:hypothetical protein